VAEPIVIGEVRDNKRVLRLGAVAVVALLAAVFLPTLLFGGGGSGDVVEDALPPVVTVPHAASSEPAPAQTARVFTSKNPFKPLIDVTPAVGSTTDPTIPPLVPPPADVAFPDGSFVVDPVLGTDPVVTPPTTTVVTVPPRQPDRVALLEVFTSLTGQTVASVRVNDVTYLVGAQSDFADRYRALTLDLTARCGDFLFADERFHLCEGDETTK
jgi:hypothetical protein